MNNKKTLAIIIPVVIGVAVLILVFTTILPKQKLAKAMNYLESGNYEEGYAILEEIERSDLIEANKRERATAYLNNGEYGEAYTLLDEIGDSETIIASKRERATVYLNNGEYVKAYDLLEQIGDSETINASRYSRAVTLIESGKDIEAYDLLKYLIKYKDSEKLKTEIKSKYPELQLKEAQVGDVIKMGKY